MSKASDWAKIPKGKPPTWTGSKHYACVAASGDMRFGDVATPQYMPPADVVLWARWAFETFGESMIPPAQLPILRALVEAIEGQHTYDLGPGWRRDCGCAICAALPAALEALERVSQDITEFPHFTNGQDLLAQLGLPHADPLSARVTQLEGALAKERGCAECWRGASCGADCRMNDVVEETR